jgi:hypothetical protein
MSNDPTVTVSIGTPDDPSAPGYLNGSQWNRFKTDLRLALEDLAAFRTFHFRGEGTGEYRGSDGVKRTELSYTLVFTIYEDISLDSLRRTLALFAAEYGQECIALTIGSTELVGPERR